MAGIDSRIGFKHFLTLHECDSDFDSNLCLICLKRGYSEKQYTQNAMVFKQGAFSPRMPWFLNRGHSEKQYSQNAMVSEQGAF